MIYVNGNAVNTTLFPDNTSQVWKIPTLEIPGTNWVHVKWDFSHEGEFIQLAQLKQLLDNKGFKAALRLSYLPYGRQDKEVSNEATFALRTFNKYIDFMDWDEIIIMDPHSSVTKDYVRNVREVYPIEELTKVLIELCTTQVCYPDKGATGKYTKIYRELIGDEFIYGEKVRDQSTGNITSYKLIGNPKGKNVLIVDDICDGGATFKLLTKDLLAQGATEVNLFVSHGIFSRGLRTLTESGINRIFTKDGEASEVQNNITYRRL
jgi:ribose-phosphate pyrophosphokinase